MKKILRNHKWLCKTCGKWIGEDYDECSFCKIEVQNKKSQRSIKNLIISNWDLLTKHRKKLFALKFKGKRDYEIARIFGVSRQAIHCAIKRTIEKINLKRL